MQKLNETQTVFFRGVCVENIVGTEENVQAFSPFPTVFSNGFIPRVVKNTNSVVKG